MTTATLPVTAVHSAVNRLVPFVHVLDVDASMAFYALLGFVQQNVLNDDLGKPCWIFAASGDAQIMFSLSSGPVDAAQQAVGFYMYSTDVAHLRGHLLAHGLHDAGVYSGHRRPDDRPQSVFAVSHPPYMPAGEMRLIDPDGYVILVGQLG